MNSTRHDVEGKQRVRDTIKRGYNVPNTRPKHKSGCELSNCASGKLIVMTKNNLLCAGREGLVRLILELAFKSHYEGGLSINYAFVSKISRLWCEPTDAAMALSDVIENRHKWVGVGAECVSKFEKSFVHEKVIKSPFKKWNQNELWHTLRTSPGAHEIFIPFDPEISAVMILM